MQCIRSLQIIETIRSEKLSISEKADRFESMCAKLTADLKHACDEIIELKQLNATSKALTVTTQLKLDEEKVENKLLRNMLYERDERIEYLTKSLHEQHAAAEAMKHAISTKDRQLVLLVKERDRLKNEIDTNNTKNIKKNAGGRNQNFTSISSPIARRTKTTNDEELVILDNSLTADALTTKSLSESVVSSERHYKSIIRKLCADLEIARKSNTATTARKI